MFNGNMIAMWSSHRSPKDCGHHTNFQGNCAGSKLCISAHENSQRVATWLREHIYLFCVPSVLWMQALHVAPRPGNTNNEIVFSSKLVGFNETKYFSNAEGIHSLQVGRESPKQHTAMPGQQLNLEVQMAFNHLRIFEHKNDGRCFYSHSTSPASSQFSSSGHSASASGLSIFTGVSGVSVAFAFAFAFDLAFFLPCPSAFRFMAAIPKGKKEDSRDMG